MGRTSVHNKNKISPFMYMRMLQHGPKLQLKGLILSPSLHLKWEFSYFLLQRGTVPVQVPMQYYFIVAYTYVQLLPTGLSRSLQSWHSPCRSSEGWTPSGPDEQWSGSGDSSAPGTLASWCIWPSHQVIRQLTNGSLGRNYLIERYEKYSLLIDRIRSVTKWFYWAAMDRLV